jgi:hypothetical protein
MTAVAPNSLLCRKLEECEELAAAMAQATTVSLDQLQDMSLGRAEVTSLM